MRPADNAYRRTRRCRRLCAGKGYLLMLTSFRDSKERSIPHVDSDRGSGANSEVSCTGIMAWMTAAETDLFKGRHFDQQVIILCVRWYLSYKLSSRDLVDMMGERGIELARTRPFCAGFNGTSFLHRCNPSYGAPT